MIERLEGKLSLLIILSILIGLFNMFSADSGTTVNLIVVNGKSNESTKSELKEVICRQAFHSWRDGKISDYYIHPDLIRQIKKSESKEFNLNDVNHFYFKMEGRDICKVVARTNKGFKAYRAVISENGLLLYRVTSIKPHTPSYTQIKEYL